MATTSPPEPAQATEPVSDGPRVSMLIKLQIPSRRPGEIDLKMLTELAQALETAEQRLRDGQRLGDEVSNLVLSGLRASSAELAIDQEYRETFVRESEVPLGVIRRDMEAVAKGSDLPAYLRPVDGVLQRAVANGTEVWIGSDRQHWTTWPKRPMAMAAETPEEPKWTVRLIGKVYEIDYRNGGARLDIGDSIRRLKLTDEQMEIIDGFRRSRVEVLARSIDAEGKRLTRVLSIGVPVGDLGLDASPLLRSELYDEVSDRLHALSRLGKGWNGHGSVGPTEKAVRGMRHLFTDIFDTRQGDVPRPDIMPGPGGELQIEWERRADRYFEAAVAADGSWDYLICDEHGEREGAATYERARRLAVMYLGGLDHE